MDALRTPDERFTGAGHFLQEDRGEELARVIVDFVGSTQGSG